MSGVAEAERIKAPNPPDQFEWTDARVEELRKLVAQRDLSYRQIATIMGGGLTRNAVLGKALRMKMRGTEDRTRAPSKPREVKARPGKRGESGKHSAKTVAARRARGEAKVPDEERIAAATVTGLRLLRGQAWEALPGSQPITLLETNEHTCKWPIGDAPIMFCGLQSEEGSAYCATHRARSVERRS